MLLKISTTRKDLHALQVSKGDNRYVETFICIKEKLPKFLIKWDTDFQWSKVVSNNESGVMNYVVTWGERKWLLICLKQKERRYPLWILFLWKLARI